MYIQFRRLLFTELVNLNYDEGLHMKHDGTISEPKFSLLL